MSKELDRLELPMFVRSDGDHSFTALQKKLAALHRLLDDAAEQLGMLKHDVGAHAKVLTATADAVAHAELDAKFADMTGDVAAAFAAGVQGAQRLEARSQETADAVNAAKRTHARLYGGLDEIRTSRRERTPKPGFLTR